MLKKIILSLFLFCYIFYSLKDQNASRNNGKLKNAPLSESMSNSKKLNSDNSKLDKYIIRLNQKNLFAGSVLIVRNGKSIYQRNFTLYGENDVELLANIHMKSFQIGSLTKQFVAAIIMKLVEEGKIDLDDNINDHIDYPHNEKLTIKSLLNHTSGIPNYIFFKDYNSFKSLSHSTREMIDRFSNIPLEFSPGTQYNYTNSGYYLLGAIIEKINNKSFEEVLKEYILLPLKMNQSGFGIKSEIKGYNYFSENQITPAEFIDISVPYTAGGMVSSVIDLQKWINGFFEYKIISRRSLNKMISPGKGNYGLGFWIDGNRIWHTGGIDGFRAIISYDIRLKELVIVLSNIHQSPVKEIEKRSRDFLRAH